MPQDFFLAWERAMHLLLPFHAPLPAFLLLSAIRENVALPFLMQVCVARTRRHTWEGDSPTAKKAQRVLLACVPRSLARLGKGARQGGSRQQA